MLELVVAIGILALILAVVPSTLRLAANAWHVSARLDAAASTETAAAFVARALAAAQPLSALDPDRRRVLAFDGSSDAVSFVTDADGPQGTIGLEWYRVALFRTGADQADLIAVRHPFAPGAGPELAIRSRHVLAGPVSELRLRYFGPPTDDVGAAPAPVWQDAWRRRARLPQLIELTIVAPGRSGRQIHSLTVEPRLRRP